MYVTTVRQSNGVQLQLPDDTAVPHHQCCAALNDTFSPGSLQMLHQQPSFLLAFEQMNAITIESEAFGNLNR